MKLFDEDVTKMLREMEELSIKYKDYARAMPSKIRFRDIQNDMEREIAQKVTHQVNWLLGVACLIFWVFNVAVFIKLGVFDGCLMLIATLFCTYFFLATFISKYKVAYGVAVWKHFRQEDIAREGTKTFFISAIFEQPEKIIVRDIQINRKDYEQVVEGTPVIIIKKGPTYEARLY